MTTTRWTRRALLRRALLGLGGLGGGTALYARGVAPFRPRVERVEVPVEGLPPALDGLTIAHLSDLHVQDGFPAARLRPAIAAANALRPDLVALTGDYTNRHSDPEAAHLPACIEALASLRARYGLFACFGNHDFPPPPADPDPAPWEAAGITPLAERAVPLTIRGATLWIVGLRSLLMRPVSPARFLEMLPSGVPRLLLWHEPDRAADAARAGATLQLSGHTHGGQVALPDGTPLILPPGGREYPAGLYRVRGMPLYVTRGVGLLPPMVRLNCPPEVTLLTLRRPTFSGARTTMETA